MLRVTKAGGRVVLSGMPSTGADLSPVWFRELELAGTYASSREEPNDRPAFETALEIAAKAPLDGVVGRGTRCTGGVRRWTTPSPPAAWAP